MCLLNHLPTCESFRSPPVHVDCWLLLVFSLKITATASKLRSKSAEQLLKLMNSREVFLSPHFQICFHWNHIIFSASACQPKLWIPGKYFSLNSFIFVTNILLLTGGSRTRLSIRRQDPNNYSDTETKALSSISHSPVLYLYICYNHIAATLHRAYSLLKLHNGIAFNGFFIKVINIKTSGLSSVLSIF